MLTTIQIASSQWIMISETVKAPFPLADYDFWNRERAIPDSRFPLAGTMYMPQ